METHTLQHRSQRNDDRQMTLHTQVMQSHFCSLFFFALWHTRKSQGDTLLFLSPSWSFADFLLLISVILLFLLRSHGQKHFLLTLATKGLCPSCAARSSANKLSSASIHCDPKLQRLFCANISLSGCKQMCECTHLSPWCIIISYRTQTCIWLFQYICLLMPMSQNLERLLLLLCNHLIRLGYLRKRMDVVVRGRASVCRYTVFV